MEKSITELRCENCAKPLYGRTDKRFCNDSCRNEFNRRKRAAERVKEYDNLPEILKIIKKNHEILQSYKLAHSGSDTMIVVDRSELLHKGFHFKFFTSIFRDRYRNLWKFCFEYGIREEHVSIVKKQCLISYNLNQIKLDNPDTYIILD